MRALATMSCVVFLLLLMGSFAGSFGDPEPNGVTGAASEKLLVLLQSEILRFVAVLSVALYGFILAIRSLRRDVQEPRSPVEAVQPSSAAISLSPDVTALRERIKASIERLNHLPADTVPVAAKLDIENMQSSHIPGLEAAHRKARAVYPDLSPQAARLDRDLATSLALIASRLDELLEECGREAQGGFATQRRFVELRHPVASDSPLALPKIILVDAHS